MLSRNELTLSDKLNLISEILERPDLLANETEGSKVIILTVSPKEEIVALRDLKLRLGEDTGMLDCAKALSETAENYGLENLAEDYDFFGKSCVKDFSNRFLSRLTRALEETSKSFPLTVVCRLGILNGFFSLNPLIEAVTGKLANPALMIYPGKREDRILKFLDGRHTASVYRAVIL